MVPQHSEQSYDYCDAHIETIAATNRVQERLRTLIWVISGIGSMALIMLSLILGMLLTNASSLSALSEKYNALDRRLIALELAHPVR